MQKQEFGFVIKRFLPQKQKFSLLSKNLGKIEAITMPPKKILQLWPGMLISFIESSKNNSIHILNNIEILSIFQDSVNFNMNWFHHIFELCYYFSSLNNPCEDIFIFLYNCLSINILENYFSESTLIIKKIYEFKLLELFGFYPKQELCCYLNLYNDLTPSSIDFSNKAQVESLKGKLNMINNTDIKKIKTWIDNYLKNHPCFRLFKTISFSRDKNETQKNI